MSQIAITLPLGCVAGTEYARSSKSIQPQLVNLDSGALQSTSDSSRDVSFPGYYKSIWYSTVCPCVPIPVCVVRPVQCSSSCAVRLCV